MHRFSLRNLLPLMLLSLVSVGGGCGDDSQQESSKADAVSEPFSEMTLELAVPAGFGFAENWQLILDEWSAQTGATVRVLEYDAVGDDRPLSRLLLEAETAKPMPSLFVVPVPRIPELAVDGLAAVIPAEQMSAENLNWNDVFSGLRGNATFVGRQLCFVPISSPALVCYYRSDLLEQAGLAPPTTWAEYQSLLETIESWAPGMTAVEPWGEEYRATMFLSRAAAFAKHPANISFCFDMLNGDPLIDHPGFVRALESSRAAVSAMPAAVRSYTTRDCRRDLLAGKAAIGISLETGPGNPPLPFGPGQSLGSVATDDTDSAETSVADGSLKLRCLRLPGSDEVYNTSLADWETLRDGANYAAVTSFAGLAIGVSVRSTGKESLAAWNLVGWLTLGNLQEAFPGATKSVCRESQVPDGPSWLGIDISPGTAQSYTAAIEASLQGSGLTAELPVVGRAAFREALALELGLYLEADGEAPDARETLANVANRWRMIAEEIGPAKVHNSQLRTLGFPAPSPTD